ncbi:MAG: formyltransferase family protein [Luteibaculaceae bacterium]
MICVAGKNEIAVFGVELITKIFRDVKICALINKTDQGIDGWQPSFMKFCKKNGIPIKNIEELYDIDNLILLSLEYDKIIKPDNFKTKKLYNMHFSLLPEYKGMYTSIWPIINGSRFSGVTLHKMDMGIDTGDIIAQTKFSLDYGIRGIQLYGLYLKHGKDLLEKNILSIIAGNYKSNKQNFLNSSYYAKSSIDFNNIDICFNKTAYQIMNFVNAFCFRPYQLPKFKGNFIVKAVVSDFKSSQKPGQIINETEFFIEIATIDYNVILYKDKLDFLLELARHDDLQGIVKLHKIGYPIDEKNEKGWDILIVSAYNNSYKTLEFLINAKIISMDSRNYKGTTVAMYAMTSAVQSNDLRCLSLLVCNGVDLSLKDFDGNDIMFYAKKYGNTQIIKFLERHGLQ